ncbi:hypothetical protein [Niabella drilacis]|nr:hypothetical protein [Niabella drilacis]
MEISPQFRGQSGFGNYLAVRIPFAQLAPATPGNAFTDTAQVRFILSPGKGMSDLTVTKAQGERFKNELNRAVKESACLWRPGGFSGREMTGWVVLNIYYTVERNKNKNDFSLHVGYELVNKFPGGNGQWNGK